MKKETVLVIGSNAFSAIDFIDLLLEEKKYHVIAVSRSIEKKPFYLTYKRHSSNDFEFYQIDLNKNLQDLQKLLHEKKPAYVINFAALVEVGPSWNNPEDWFQTNAVSVTSLGRILSECKFIKKFVQISTPEVYGSCSSKIDETAQLNPSTPYAASKAAGDLSLFTYVKNFSLPMCVVRSTNVFGRGQSLFKIVPRVALYIKLGKKITLDGGGVAVKSFIPIRDISRGELAIMLNGKIGEIYHLSPDGLGVSVKNLVSLICKKMNVSFDSCVEVGPERLGQDKAYIIDSSKARETLNWKPLLSLEKGVEDVVQWVEENFDEMSKESLEYCHKL